MPWVFAEGVERQVYLQTRRVSREGKRYKNPGRPRISSIMNQILYSRPDHVQVVFCNLERNDVQWLTQLM
eukprot:82872-Prorocentrum_lima.AAC.1